MLQPSDTLAAIDVGTNSFHLIVVKFREQKQFSLITKEKAVVRLGESPTQMKKLSEEAMLRGIEALTVFKQIAGLTNSPIRAVATSAVREASNAEEFIDRVREATGINIEVVSGFEEARLIYLGVMQALPIFNDRVALFDIGGGSTEFVVGHEGHIEYANSFKIGAIRLTQRCFPNENITRDQIENCRLFVRGEIYHAAQEIRRSKPQRAIASSGTAQTVASMILAMRGELIPETLNGVVVTAADVRKVLNLVLDTKTHRERAALPGVDPRRADILVGGCLVLDTILSDCGFSEYTISSYALREGVVLDSIQKWEGDPEMLHLSDLRYETVMKIGRMYSFDEPHGRHVADLALEIFDALAPVHGLDAVSREWLEASALLHDIGYYISHSGHHKHSQYLIQNGEMLGFNNEEIAIIANVARYHRKSHPKKAHPEFTALSRADQQIIRYLAGILRVADGLDRTHKENVEFVEVQTEDGVIEIVPSCRDGCNPTFEIWSANRKKGLMEEVFGREVTIVSLESTPALE
ncbi:MAG: Ppx/GppA family phosphatase [bacterium]|nr:Ppx/GppA family phosphatase [Candidatus Kapabacteria bacterium]